MCQRHEDTCASLILWTTSYEWYKYYCKFNQHNWYEDWICVECCQDDRCNRYVTEIITQCIIVFHI